MEKALFQLYNLLDQRQDKLIERLKKFVSIKSISEQPEHRLDVVRALRWIGMKLNKLGCTTQVYRLGKEKLYTGDHIPLDATDELELPDVLAASTKYDITKKTLLIYGHVDVKAVHVLEKWNHDPFDMQVVNGYMCGRGVTDDKGPLLAWINVLETFRKAKMLLPINLKFIIEGMEECGSEGLMDLLGDIKFDFFRNVDFVVISDNYWLNQTTPCLTYGLRGVIYFYVTVEGSERLLHSGCHGGAVVEPMTDLVYLLSLLCDSKGRPTIPGLMQDIQGENVEEIERFGKLDFADWEYQQQIRVPGIYTNDKVDLLKRRWCQPSISIHGVEHSFDKPGAPTIICNKVMGKFSVRIVPDQNPKKIARLVERFLTDAHERRGTPNTLDVKVFRDGRPFLADHKTVNFNCAARAIERVWGKSPDLTRDGAAIPVAIALEESTMRDVCLIPMGQCLDYQHEYNERLAVENYMNGMKVFLTYFYELASCEAEDSDDEAERQQERAKWRAKML